MQNPKDAKAIKIPAPAGANRVLSPKKVVVVGGGIAGLAAATALAERGVKVEIIEAKAQLGGRLRAWPIEVAGTKTTMSRGFHAFFRQYYNLRSLLRRAGKLDEMLTKISDYPVISSLGDKDSFAQIPSSPPFNFMAFVAKSPTFKFSDLLKVDLEAALSLLDVSFPETFRELEAVSAAEFLDQLKFPHRARHLALEVFARSFFAHPSEFSAGELVAMFHSYFLGSAEGLLFDVAAADFDTALWQPLTKYLKELDVQITTAEVEKLEKQAEEEAWKVFLSSGESVSADAVVLAAGPAKTPSIIANSSQVGSKAWRDEVAKIKVAPQFAVLRIWTDAKLNQDRAPFLGTANFQSLDNISLVHLYEQDAKEWAKANDGSVIELHAYALTSEFDNELRTQLLTQLELIYPETKGMNILHEELLVEQDCALPGLGKWDLKPTVASEDPTLKLAGDFVRTELPIALMEKAATTGFMAANQLLSGWAVAGVDLWSTPIEPRQKWPGQMRKIVKKFTKN